MRAERFIYSFRISCHIFFLNHIHFPSSFLLGFLPPFHPPNFRSSLPLSLSLKYGMLQKFGCHPYTWAMLIFSVWFQFLFMCCWREQNITSFFSGKELCHWESASSSPTWSTGPLEVRLPAVSWSAAGIRPSCPLSSYSSQLPFTLRNLWDFPGSRASLEGRILERWLFLTFEAQS